MKTSWFRSTVLAAALAALSATAAAADEMQLRAEAGLAGLARPGRWTPVRVALENGRDALSGDLIVEWGDARVRRAVTLPPSARRQIELDVRTMNVRDVVLVRFEANGGVVQRTEIPVRIVRYEEPLVACVGATASATTGDRPCTVTLTADSAPTSWRGYDAADDLVGPQDARAVSAEKQQAIALWRDLRVLEEAGRLARPRGPAPDGVVHPMLRASVLAYAVAFPLILFVVARVAPRARTVFATAVVFVAAASVGALAIGRVGPGRAVHVRAAGILHQFPQHARSWILLRGFAEYPTAGSFELRAPVQDAAFDTAGARGTHEDQRYDDGGYPVLSGRFALGARKPFTLEGAGDLKLVEVTPRAAGVHVANVSGGTLADCSVRTGSTDRPLGELAAGASLDIAGAAAGEQLTLSCTAPASTLAFSETARPVVTAGRLELVVHLSDPRES